MKQLQKTVLALALLALSALSFSPVVAQDDGSIPQRSDIEDKYKWDLNSIYPSIEDWEADFAYVEEHIADFESFKGHLGDSPDVLAQYFKFEDEMGDKIGNMYVYANLWLDMDQRSDEAQEFSGRIRSLYGRYGAASSFATPEIIAIGGDKLHSWLDSSPELDIYQHYLNELLRNQEYVLSAEEEQVLANASDLASTPSNIFSMLNNADLKFGEYYDEDSNLVQLTRQRWAKIYESDDRRLRRDANQVYNEAYLKYENTLAATLAASVQRDHFYTKSRGYESTLASRLHGSNIPDKVFNSLLDAVNENLEPMHKWTSIRKRILGYDTLYTYDMGAPLIDMPDKEYTYEEATEIVLNALAPLGEEYVNDLRKGIASRWVDVYETEGKETGAYSWGSYETHPFVLMNFNGTLNDIFTLAHEFGHAMNTYYTNQNEHTRYAGHATFTAEVASTFNEALLMKYLLERAETKEEKIALLIQYIQNIDGTFFTQCMFSEFENYIHGTVAEGGALTPKSMRAEYRNIFQKYEGPDLTIGPINDQGCLRISHFYRSYYVYQYATSFAAAQMLSQKVLEGDKAALEAYHNFLATGTSMYPMDILQAAGVDMTTTEPYDRTISKFAELVDEVEKLLDEG